MRIIDFKKRKMKLFTNEQQEKRQKSVIFVKKNLKINIGKLKNFVKLEIIVIIQGNADALRIAYVI